MRRHPRHRVRRHLRVGRDVPGEKILGTCDRRASSVVTVAIPTDPPMFRIGL